uniref:Uncharacterized protein n=1 Tax=Wuchereria bancrofti TaxID=6293 RepID=A0AAF5PW38_WUCBA
MILLKLLTILSSNPQAMEAFESKLYKNKFVLKVSYFKKFHAKSATATDSSLKNVKSKSIKSVIKSYYKSFSKSKWKLMRPTATGFSKKTFKKSSQYDIIKKHAPKLDEGKLFEGCHNMKNMKAKSKESSKSKSKSISVTYNASDYDDDTDVENMTNAFAIILPEYMIRSTDECDTVFEKIEDEMRPKKFPHLSYNRYNDDY